MKIQRGVLMLMAFLLTVIWVPWSRGETAPASHCAGGPALCGELGPLIPFHKDAIHAGLGWTERKTPKICFWMRPSEYQGIHLVDPLRPPGPGALRTDTFEKFVYGNNFTAGKGFSFSLGPHGLDESLATRIQADLYLDNALCFDLTHPAAFQNSGKFNIADLTEADFDLNRAAFSNAGHTTGLNYNIFCAAQVALANGEWVVVGGHDKAGNNGIRKINIFNPATQQWIDRGMPSVKAAFLADQEITNPAAHPDPNIEANTDPDQLSDMRYQRWYPTAVHLPTDEVLILSGTDQDSSLVRGGGRCASAAHSPACSKYRLNTPEIYDRKLDRTIALENAWKVLSMYPIAYTIQTGPNRKDWKVVVIGEADHEAGGPFFGDFRDHRNPIGFNIAGYDPWPYSGKTYLFDVQAAIKALDRDIPDETGKYWEHVATAAIAHESGASSMLVKLDKTGRPISQKLVLFGGGCGSRPTGFSCNSATVEMIDFSAPNPLWVSPANLKLMQEASQQQAVALPDGMVLIAGGNRGRPGGIRGWTNSFYYQLFDPYTETITPLIETTSPWHDHATMVLLPDGSVISMGGNRTDKVFFTDPLGVTCQAGEQCSSQQTRTAGVPVAQVFKPPYFFKGDRPRIDQSPDEIFYKQRFAIRVSKVSGRIGTVAMIQQHPVTHNHQWNRRVEMSFEQKPDGVVEIQAPRFPGVAPPGNYLLFIISDEGVPSEARLVHLNVDGDREGAEDGGN